MRPYKVAELLAKRLCEEIEDKIKAIVLYGSVARDKARKGGNIDPINHRP